MESVAIGLATCRRSDLLRKSLLSLNEIIVPEELRVEIFIADNDSMPSNQETVDEIANNIKFPISYFHFNKPGIPNVRNFLLKIAAESYVDALLFIDDDEEVDKFWLVSMWNYYSMNRGNVVALEGPVLAKFTDQVPPWIPVDLYSSDRKLTTGTPRHVAKTGNLMLSMDFIRETGLRFDERMAFTGGSDTEFTWRITKNGGSIRWCSEAIVYENVNKGRLTVSWLVKRHFRYGTSDAMFWKLNHSRIYSTFWIMRRSFWNLLKSSVGFIFSGLNSSGYVKYYVMAYKSFGLIFGLIGYSYNEYDPKRYRKKTL